MKSKESRRAIKHAKVMNIDRWKGSPHRAEAPTPQAPRPPGPRPPIPLERYRKSGPGGPGLCNWVPPAPALSCLVKCYSNEPEALNTYQHTSRPRRPEGAAEWGWGLGAEGWGQGLGGGPEQNRPVRWPVRWPVTDRPFSKNRVPARCGGKSRSESRSPRLDLI